MEEEAQIIQQAARGSIPAFEKLVTGHAQYVYNLALRILQNAQEAEDISQEAFLRVWKALPTFRQDANFRTWLYRIVVNLCYDRLPRLRREMNAMEANEILELPAAAPTPENELLSTELNMRLLAGFEKLPGNYRLLLSLRHLQEMSYEEIAAVTNLPLGTVKTGIHRGRQLLKEKILEYQNG